MNKVSIILTQYGQIKYFCSLNISEQHPKKGSPGVMKAIHISAFTPTFGSVALV